jgi:Amt family ammonium transporter
MITEILSTPVIDTGTTAWMLISTALVLLMVPGLAMFYGGLVRTKNVVGTMMHTFASMAVIGVLWTICGYSMSFGESRGWCGWSDRYFLLQGIDESIRPSGIPEYVFAMFQGKFAIIAPALIAGAFAERVRFLPYLIFITLWSLLVYFPLAHWIWGGGFLTGRAIDFAGGTVIHVSAGVAALVAAARLGARRGYPGTAMHPSNLVMTLVGAGLLWVGWFGFNAGSAESSGLRTAQALTMTQISAASGALAWLSLEALHHRKATGLGLASGILAGLVAVTPAAGDVTTLGALVLGLIASCACYVAILTKNRSGLDDSLDVFGVHGVAGIVGAIALCFFLREQPGRPELLEQLWFQVEGLAIASGYSAVITFALIEFLRRSMRMRLDDNEQRSGMDHVLHREHGYGMLNLN